MAYVNQVFTEGTLMTDLKNLIVANGWTFEKTLYKVVYSNFIIDPDEYIDQDDNVNFAVAKHMIFKNANNRYYGLAQLKQFSVMYKDIPHKPKTDLNNPSIEQDMIDWVVETYGNDLDRHTIVAYMIEQIPSMADGTNFGHAVDYQVSHFRGAIDLEVEKSKFLDNGSGNWIFEYTQKFPERMQSPFVEMVFRNPNLQGIDAKTNWWPDSLVTVQGFIDSETVFLLFQMDKTPAFENNVVPLTPLYMGDFISFRAGDTGNAALWGGTAFHTGNETQSKTFDFDSVTPYHNVNNYLPILKTYPNKPANGIDHIIVQRSDLGARYQAYYLSWSTANNQMPPDRVGTNGGKYPQAWLGSANDEYKYKFNPSMYSGKVHTSRAYLVHPDEGVRGYLPKMILLSPFGLVNGDKLKVRKAACPDQFDIYRFFLTEAISPVTKRPATVYRPAGIGIYEKTV
jgi:hypothetical protein